AGSSRPGVGRADRRSVTIGELPAASAGGGLTPNEPSRTFLVDSGAGGGPRPRTLPGERRRAGWPRVPAPAAAAVRPRPARAGPRGAGAGAPRATRAGAARRLARRPGVRQTVSRSGPIVRVIGRSVCKGPVF